MAAGWEIGSRNDVTKGIMSLGIMKKLLLAILATTALAACSDHTIDATPNVAIEFGDLKTRAVNDVSDIDSFKVCALMNCGPIDPANDDSFKYVTLLDNEIVTATNEVDANNNRIWSYNNTRYWVNDRIFYFYALHIDPADDSKKVQIVDNSSSNSFPAFNLSFSTPVEAQTDILTASSKRVVYKEAENYPPVDLAFQHKLTWINLKICKDKTAMEENTLVVVTKVSVEGIAKDGTLVAEYDGTSNDISEKWNRVGSETLSYTSEYTDESGSVDTQDFIYPLGVNGKYFIPQDISANQIRISLSWKIDYNSQGNWKTKDTEIYIPAGEWKIGQKITYTLALSEVNEIIIGKPTVESWGEPQSGGTIIIK